MNKNDEYVKKEYHKNKEQLEDTIRKTFHDLRTYAGIAINSLDLLKCELSEKNISEEYKQLFDIATSSLEKQLEIMQNSQEQITKPINQILEKYKPVNLKKIMHDNYSLTKNLAIQKNIQLLKNYEHLEDDFTINADEMSMNRILHNVITNAIKYTNEGHVEIGCKKNLEDINIYVKDSGIGIPQQDLVQVFNKGYRASNSNNFEGTGYGLEIVQDYVTKIGGNIKIDSKEGCGTTVNINLPLKY